VATTGKEKVRARASAQSGEDHTALLEILFALQLDLIPLVEAIGRADELFG
jgi:hypothetical protein